MKYRHPGARKGRRDAFLFFWIMKQKARILVFTGDGKGKTTAALGLVLRAVGHQMPAFVVQFIKNAGSTGELTAFRQLPLVRIEQRGLGFVPPPQHPTYKNHKKAAQAALLKAKTVVNSRRYKVVVLDEICNALHKKLISQKAVLSLIKGAPHSKIIVLTGRHAPHALIALADTATEMTCLKHGFEADRPAEKGVEF
jgi:cob(I)alamin adenosyltransferase